jgi:hypothetical protein
VHSVIQARDPDSLVPRPLYFLVFPNPASAAVYRKHVERLHEYTKAHMPTYLGDPMPLASNVSFDRGDVHVHRLWQEYTLSQPSQRQPLRELSPPYSSAVQSILAAGGYDLLVSPNESPRAGRSVLFWVEGYQPTSHAVHTMLVKDGQTRGLQWSPAGGKGEIKMLDTERADFEDDEGHKQTNTGRQKGSFRRWLLSFEDEAEAQRFVRTWHGKEYHFPTLDERPDHREPLPLIHAEFVW